MNDEEKWNSGNAPQNDRDTERFGEPPRYEHYNMHQIYVNETGYEPERKKRKKKIDQLAAVQILQTWLDRNVK